MGMGVLKNPEKSYEENRREDIHFLNGKKKKEKKKSPLHTDLFLPASIPERGWLFEIGIFGKKSA